MNRIICNECITVEQCMQGKTCIHVSPTMTAKPVVYYKGTPKFLNWIGDPDRPVARLPYVLNHPSLGDCKNVRTSVILRVLKDGTIFTLNTIYKPLAQEEMGS